jgi:uncharacterized protein (TIGR02271 family)
MLEKFFNGDERDNNDANQRNRETLIRDRMAAQGITEEEATRLVLSEEELAVGRREVNAGEVSVGKHVETERVRENVTLHHDEVEIERRPISEGYAASGAMIGDEREIRIPLTAEEVVVEKRVVPTEEIVVRKRSVAENETVETDLRHERADIHREGETFRGETAGRDPLLDRDRMDR